LQLVAALVRIGGDLQVAGNITARSLLIFLFKMIFYLFIKLLVVPVCSSSEYHISMQIVGVFLSDGMYVHFNFKATC
jgi:hypothetical protein